MQAIKPDFIPSNLGVFVPSAELLRNLAVSDGIDVATTVLYTIVREAAANRSIIDAIESTEARPRPREAPLVVIVPGAFHVEYPHTGAGGGRILEIASELGWPHAVVPLPSLAPMAKNAEAIARFLASRGDRPIVLVSLSKGSADVTAALGGAGSAAAFERVIAWVSVSGMVHGSPLVKWVRDRPLRCLCIRLLMWLRRQPFAALAEMDHRPDAHLRVAWPQRLRMIHVLGFPLQRHLSDAWAKRGHARLAPLGPNDGGGILLADALNLPGAVYPVWGADHYMRPAFDVRSMLRNVLLEAARY